jgi:hypothetical protein
MYYQNCLDDAGYKAALAAQSINSYTCTSSANAVSISTLVLTVVSALCFFVAKEVY